MSSRRFKFTTYPSLAGLITFGLLAISGTLTCTAGEAQMSASELREMQRQVEFGHNRALNRLNEGLAAQTVDAADGPGLRAKIDSEFQSRMEFIKEQKAALAGPASPYKGAAGAPSISVGTTGLPRIESQSTITYPVNPGNPGGDETSSVEENPAREGRQKNVGLGTRELEF